MKILDGLTKQITIDMAETKKTDNFIYIHDDYEECNFCSQKYKDYGIFEYSGGQSIDIEFFPKKMDALGIVVDAKYWLTYFEAKHPKLLKDQGIPYDTSSYADYLKAENSMYKKNKRDVLAIINKKVASKKRGIFKLDTIPFDKEYLDNCIANKQERIFLGLRIHLNEISVAKINKDAPYGTGIDSYKNISEVAPEIRDIISGLKPERIHHILTAYHTQESFDEGDVENFLTGAKDFIEEIDEVIHYKDSDFIKLLKNIARLCFLWRDKQKISSKFIKEANNFILLRREIRYNPVIEFIGLFFDDLINDAKENNQLIECAHCHLLAKYYRNKKFCSKTTDGKNCFAQYHSKKDYARHKAKRLNTKKAWINKTRKEIPGY
ncbi:MAG: hypothetical protein PHY73_01760 [Candidatus Omnitrophica bacterium]|nr:hypothetical protein [Candidatus Omnitrophota bacterium]